MCAVGVNPIKPVITAEMANWAISIIEYSTKRLVAKFASGDVGDGMSKQMADMKKAFKHQLNLSPERAAKLGLTPEMVRDHVFSRRGLQQQLGAVASFKNAREGTARAFETVLRELQESGIISMFGTSDLISRYGKDTGRYFVVRDPKWLFD